MSSLKGFEKLSPILSRCRVRTFSGDLITPRIKQVNGLDEFDQSKLSDTAHGWVNNDVPDNVVRDAERQVIECLLANSATIPEIVDPDRVSVKLLMELPRPFRDVAVYLVNEETAELISGSKNVEKWADRDVIIHPVVPDGTVIISKLERAIVIGVDQDYPRAGISSLFPDSTVVATVGIEEIPA